MSVVEMVG